VCAVAGSTVGGIDAVLASTEQSQIRGQVTHENGARVAGAQVQLYAAAGDGSRGAFLRSTATDDAGWYSFDLPAACYIVVLVAPDGERFQSGATTDRRKLCIGEGAALTPVDGVLAGWARSPTALSAVELEMVRLTNELRANPAGPLARRAPLPSCVDDAFYRLSVDPATGHPTAAPPLTVDELVSVEMARVWSVEMERSAGFEHRASTSQEQTYDQLGVAVEAWGENIAWLAGFGRAAAARIHFEGWRESETGHYCAMLSPRFSHIGVGEHWSDDESWAVQNFYRPR
jgi:hypothetical protein